jgi:hypothetical protein
VQAVLDEAHVVSHSAMGSVQTHTAQQHDRYELPYGEPRL